MISEVEVPEVDWPTDQRVAVEFPTDAYAEVLEVLQLTPWNGWPQHEDNPEGAPPALDVRRGPGPARWYT